MEKRSIVDVVFNGFLFNLILTSLLAFGAFHLTHAFIVEEHAGLSFMAITFLIFLIVPLRYGYKALWRRLQEDNTKKARFTLFFVIIMLFLQPFIIGYALLPYLSPGLLDQQSVVRFSFFLVELAAFLPLLLGYIIVSNILRERAYREKRMKAKGSGQLKIAISG